MLPLPTERYQIIYADPPWEYKMRGIWDPGDPDDDKPVIPHSSAKMHYSTLSIPEMAAIDIPSITDKDCLLFMWVSSPCLIDGFALAKHWGFKHATVGFVWDKMLTNPGFYTMSQVELCLVFKHGRIPKPRGARNIRQLVQQRRRAHSEKPAEVRRRINEMFPDQSKIELFARERVLGWSTWGHEAPTHETRMF